MDILLLFFYLQIRDYVRSKIPDFKTLPQEHVFSDILRSPPDSRHLISRFVHLLDDCKGAATDRVREAWEGELGMELSKETREKCLAMIQSCSVNSRHQLIQFKVVHRLHNCKLKLHKITPSVSPLCDRCKVSEGALFHTFWPCPLLTGLWDKIFDWFSKAYKRPLQPEAELAIFGCLQTTASLPAAKQQSLYTGDDCCKRLILLQWKSAFRGGWLIRPQPYKWKDSGSQGLIQLENLWLFGAPSLPTWMRPGQMTNNW